MKERHIIYALLAALLGAFMAVPTIFMGDVIFFSIFLGAATLGILFLREKHRPSKINHDDVRGDVGGPGDSWGQERVDFEKDTISNPFEKDTKG